MGNKLATQTPQLDYYLHDLPGTIVSDQSLNNSPLLKCIKCVHDEGPVVVKVYIKRSPNADLTKYVKQLTDLRDTLQIRECKNVYPSKKFIVTDKAGYIIRQYFAYNLHDRIGSRPFLNTTEKMWITFQLLKALSESNMYGIYHGDIKSENIMLTSWNWVYLVDFSCYKPTHIPEDGPSEFSFFFDTSGRRTCYIAPERFISGKEVVYGELTHEMDIFSLGCVIAELFLDGVPRSIFTLAQLLSYRKGDYDPTSFINRIDCDAARELIKQMISKEPESRKSSSHYLSEWENLGFPSYFEKLHSYIYNLVKLSPDDKIRALYNDFDKLVQIMTPSHENPTKNHSSTTDPAHDHPAEQQNASDTQTDTQTDDGSQEEQQQQQQEQQQQQQQQQVETNEISSEEQNQISQKDDINIAVDEHDEAIHDNIKQENEKDIYDNSEKIQSVEVEELDDYKNNNFDSNSLSKVVTTTIVDKHDTDKLPEMEELPFENLSFSRNSDLKIPIPSDLPAQYIDEYIQYAKNLPRDGSSLLCDTDNFLMNIESMQSSEFYSHSTNDLSRKRKQSTPQLSSSLSTSSIMRESQLHVKNFHMEENEDNQKEKETTATTTTKKTTKTTNNNNNNVESTWSPSIFPTITNSHQMNKEDKKSLPGMILLLSILCSDIHRVVSPTLKVKALNLFILLSEYLDDNCRLQRIIPYIISILHDDSAIVRSFGIKALVTILDQVDSFPASDVHIFPEYIIPSIDHLSNDPELIVKESFAKNLAKLAEISKRFLEASQLLLQRQMTSEQFVNMTKDKYSYSSNYDSSLNEIHSIFSSIISQMFWKDCPSSVKSALLSDIARLAMFFGKKKTSDLLLPMIVTFLNENDWELRSAFFQHVVGLCEFVGGQSLECFVYPCILQALSDKEEFVIDKAINSLASMASKNLFRKQTLYDIARKTSPLLLHPNIWIRNSVIAALACISNQLDIVDQFTFLNDLIRPFLSCDIIHIQMENLSNAVLPPLSRSLYETAVHACNKALQSWASNNAQQKNARRKSQSRASSGHIFVPQKPPHPYDPEDSFIEIFIEILESVDILQDQREPILMMSSYIKEVARHIVSAESSSIRSANMIDNTFISSDQIGIKEHYVSLPDEGDKHSAIEYVESNPSEWYHLLNFLITDTPSAFNDSGSSLPKQNISSSSSQKQTNTTKTPINNQHSTMIHNSSNSTLSANSTMISPSNSINNSFDNSSNDNSSVNVSRQSSNVSVSSNNVNNNNNNNNNNSVVTQTPINNNNNNIPSPSQINNLNNSNNNSNNTTNNINNNRDHPYQQQVMNPHAHNHLFENLPSEKLSLIHTFPLLQTPPELPDYGYISRKDGGNLHGGNATMNLNASRTITASASNTNNSMNSNHISSGMNTLPGSTSSNAGGSAFGSSSSALKSWKPSGTLVAHLTEHKQSVNKLCISEDNQFFASCSNDGTVKVWDCQRLEKKVTNRARLSFDQYKEGGKLLSMCMLKHSHSIACGSEHGRLSIFRVDCDLSRKDVIDYKHFTMIERGFSTIGAITAMDHFNRSMESLIVCSTSVGHVHGFDLRMKNEAFIMDNTSKAGSITSMIVDPSKHWLLTGTIRGCYTCWDLRFKIPVATWWQPGKDNQIYRLAHRQSTSFFSSVGNGLVNLWDINDQDLKSVWQVVDVEQASQASLVLPPIERRGVPPTPKSHANRLKNIPPQIHTHRALAVPPGFNYFITGSADKCIRYWNINNPSRSSIISGLDTANQSQPKYFNERHDVVEVCQEIPSSRPFTTFNSGPALERTLFPSTNHRDCILDIVLGEQPLNMIISASRDGVIKVWK